MAKQGKNSRIKAKARRAKAKAEKKAEWAAKIAASRNSKSTAGNRRGRSWSKHPFIPCGNLGCSRCYPQYRMTR